VEYDICTSLRYQPMSAYGTGEWMTIRHNGYGPFGKGSAAIPGDSSSPAFMIWSNHPVLLFATTFSGDAEGLFISGPTNWVALTNAVDMSDVKIVPTAGYNQHQGTNLNWW
jgi:hypothetical protein